MEGWEAEKEPASNFREQRNPEMGKQDDVKNQFSSQLWCTNGSEG